VAGDPIGRDGDAEALSDVEFVALMRACPRALDAKRIAVGVSGGADSMALVLLAEAWARQHNVVITALTVDHGLRVEASDEARLVGQWLGARGISHQTLTVKAPRPSAGLQNAARNWRFAAFDSWCRDNCAGPILLAHTLEDQAETLWLRIMADSGPDGLGGIRAENRVAGLSIARPLLSVSKKRLIATCKAQGQAWVEDPSNRNPNFTRVRLRALAPIIAAQGLGSDTARRITSSMGKVRGAVDLHCAAFMREYGEIMPAGIAWFDGEFFAGLFPTFGDLLLSRLCSVLGGGAFPPRRRRVTGLADALRSSLQPMTRTLGGCVISRRRDGRVHVFREAAPCARPVRLEPGRVTRWDNRFEARWLGPESVYLGALGEEGWTWMKRDESNFEGAEFLAELPHAARLTIPVIRELDGTASVPHFVVGDGVKLTAFGSPLEIGFSPDSEWASTLIKSSSED
jgi:tRNA(Ile)-lysidine synthase